MVRYNPSWSLLFINDISAFGTTLQIGTLQMNRIHRTIRGLISVCRFVFNIFPSPPTHL